MVQLCLVVLCNLCVNALNQILGFELSYFFNLHKLSVFIEITSNNKLCFNWQFLSCEAKSLFSDIKRNAFYFEEDTSGSYRSNPTCGISFSFTHTHISWLTSNWFIRKYTNPNLTFTLHVTIHCYTSCFYLTAVEPFSFKSLDAE